MKNLVPYLKELALRNGIRKYISISSKEIANKFHISQQSGSRVIISLAKAGLIERRLMPRGQMIKITRNGNALLMNEYLDYTYIFEKKRKLNISGIVVSGLGEGRYYISQKGYMNQFKTVLGIVPYPGTLNIKLSPTDAYIVSMLREEDGIRINGFESEGRTFGHAKCFRTDIDGVEGYTITPLRTHHSDIIEVISEIYLRKKLGLKDGKKVKCTIEIIRT